MADDDAVMEHALAATIDSSVAAAAGGTITWLLIPAQYQHHLFQEPETPAAQLLRPDDDEGHIAGDVVASLLDEISPRDSDLDEWILECPVTQRLVLLAMASLQQEVDVDAQISSLLLESAAEAYGDGGFGAVPADAAAVASLGKQTFRAARAGAGGGGGSGDHHSCGGGSVTRTCCGVCLEDFEDGDEMSVMPCSGGHGFHTNCIADWLGRYSNMCPLCRHALPTGGS